MTESEFIEAFNEGFDDGAETASIAFEVGQPEMYNRGMEQRAKQAWLKYCERHHFVPCKVTIHPRSKEFD